LRINWFTVGIVSLHPRFAGLRPGIGLRGLAPAFDTSARMNIAHPARTNIVRAKRNRAIRENFAK
jgi:hypothetical protein